MRLKDVIVGVILAFIGLWLSSFVIGMMTFSFGTFIILVIGDILFLFGIVLMNYGRNITRG
jgi:uncharacterized membrane protein YeaQ/YmgE (transglycosylase-associated protein family)